MSSSSSFFLKKGKKNTSRKPNLNQKGERTGKNEVAPRNKRNSNTSNNVKTFKRKRNNDEEIPSDEEELSNVSDNEDSINASQLNYTEDGQEHDETAQDKRLRLAKQYLKEIEKEEAERAEERELHTQISKRLHTEYLDSVGKLRRNIASLIEGYDAEETVTLKHQKQHLSICSLALCPGDEYLFSGAKTPYVLKWHLRTCRIVGSFNVQPHSEESNTNIKRRCQVIAMCLSSDGCFLALADGGKTIQIWCPKELKHLKTFHGHRDKVTGLVFRRDSHDLYSSSLDRSVKVWSIDEMAYVESLYGHRAAITSIDALSRERAITSGGSDSTIRIWKITEESQLVYNGSGNNIEAVKFLNEEHFVSSSTDGSLSLWTSLRKKPVHTEIQCHGTQASNNEANWITAIASLVNTDLLASGSCDGFIRLWQVTENYRALKPMFSIPICGFVNNLVFNADGSKLFAAIGQEHRLGRWWRLADAKNHILVIDLQKITKLDAKP